MKKIFFILISFTFLYAVVFIFSEAVADEESSSNKQVDYSVDLRIEKKLWTQIKSHLFSISRSELLLKMIASGSKNQIKINLPDGSKILNRKGGGIDLFNAQTGKNIFLNNHVDFKHLLDGATKAGGFSSYGNIMDSDTLNDFLDSNVYAFYSQFSGGNYRAKNRRGSGRFRYKRIRQVLASSTDPRSVDIDSQIRGFDCYCSSVTHVFKSLGLIVPDYSRNQVENRYTHIFNDQKMGKYRRIPWDKNYTIPKKYTEALRGRSTFSSGQRQISIVNFLEIAKGLRKTNWAKLTGMADVKLYLGAMGNIDLIRPFIKLGYVARVCLVENFSWHYVAPVDIQVTKKNKLVTIDDSWFVKKVLIYKPDKFKDFWVICVRGRKSNIKSKLVYNNTRKSADENGLILAPLSVSRDYVPFIKVYWLPKDSRILNFNSHLIQNVTPLGLIKALRRLDLSNNPLRTIKPLSKLKNLEILNLRRTYIKDISPLKNLNKLVELNIKYTLVKDISKLPTSLRKLYLDNNISRKKINKFKVSHPNCKLYFDDGYIDKDPRKGPLDERWLKR